MGIRNLLRVLALCDMACGAHCFFQKNQLQTTMHSIVRDERLQEHSEYFPHFTVNKETDTEHHLMRRLSDGTSPINVANTLYSRRAAVIACGGVSSILSAILPSWAESDATIFSSTTLNELLDKLRMIPTFCIVSNSTGAAYMLYKRDLNMGIGYAFLTFSGALAVLKDAQENAIQKGYGDVWTNATITTIPLDVAIRLALKKRSRISSKEQSLDTLLMLIPGAEERLDGMAIDKTRFQEQGRVPLFYVESISQVKPDEIVLYFQRKDLLSDWIKSQSQPQSPVVKAIDLVGIFESLLLGRNVEGKVASMLLSSKLAFMPNTVDVAIAEEMKARGLAPYNPNKMIL